MIIDDYIEYTNTYKSKYGNKCIVLMQVGSFYELYSIKDDISEDIYSIGDICNIQISRKNKSISEVSINNPLMAGFPLYTLKKFTTILLNNNYTIVLVEQVSEPPNPERKITEILSPGMNLNVSGKNNNYMMVLYYEYIEKEPLVGIAGIDLSTGNSFVFETGSTKQDPELVSDEVFRLISTYNPSELIILSDKKYDDSQKSYLIKNLNLNSILTHFIWDKYEYIDNMKKISYQIAILEKAFSVKKSIISIIETLNLEKNANARIALCCLLQFAYEHNYDIIKKLNIPEIIHTEAYLSIEYNSAVQLNIIGLYQNDKPLINILNRCLTPFGSRSFKERLLKPIIDKQKLNERYDDIEYLLENKRYEKIGSLLCSILDLERIKRKMQLSKFHPQEWCNFDISMEKSIEILKNYYKKYDISIYLNIINSYKTILDFTKISKYNLSDIKENIFYKGIYYDIDEYVSNFEEAYSIIDNINNTITNIDINDNTLSKIDFNEKDGYFISMTKKRYNNAVKKNDKYMKDFNVKHMISSNNVKLVNDEISLLSNKIEEAQNNISKLVLIHYHEFVSDFIDKYSNDLDILIKIIINIDIAYCGAKNAFEYRYYRPTIVDNESSFIDAKNIRHPIIERIDDSVPYVGNDIKLKNGDKNGMLLYGINAAGKSSLMKSIGLNIIMAQAGMFVSSNDMCFSPYKHIFTRISGMDNIYKGMSSFTVEMTELRNILQRCDKNSLVLGDEICSGTESISALAIVAAGINTLVKKGASFIFATHLHDLTELDIIKSIEYYIYISHIHITINENNIIYERKLKEGKGNSTYGIEVCSSLDMPSDFMTIAENVRKKIMGYSSFIINPTKSRYNSNIYMNECIICGEKALDTHHIKYQNKSDSFGYFNNFHKNIKHNLIQLCKDCHIKEHNGELSIKGYKKTSKGIVVDSIDTSYNINPSNNNDNDNDADSLQLALNEEDYDKIKEYVKRGKCNWFIRNNKTNMYKKCTNNSKILNIISNITNKKIIALDENISKMLYDHKL